MKTLRLKIPSGDAGADVTARALRQLIEHGKRDPLVRQAAISILKTKDVAPHDQWGEVRALHGWVQRNVRYVKDPYHIEYVQTPSVMLTTMTGDCDDYTAFLGALLESVGYPVDIKIVARSGRPTFHHVYPTVNLDGVSVGLDASMPVPFGFQSSDLKKQRVYRSELNPMIVSDVYGRVGTLMPVKAPLGVSPEVHALIDRYVTLKLSTGELCKMSATEFEAGFQRMGGVTLSLMPRETRSVIFRRLSERFAVEQARCRTGATLPPPVIVSDPYKKRAVAGCAGIRWPAVVLRPGSTLTDRCLRERIAGGSLKAASGCVLEVSPTATAGVSTVVCVQKRATGFVPPSERPGTVMPPLPPAGVASCPGFRSIHTLHAGEVIRGRCVKKYVDRGSYRPAAGCKLVYQGPDDPTLLSGPEGTITCVPVGYDQPPDTYSPDTYVPPSDGWMPPGNGWMPPGDVAPAAPHTLLPGPTPTIVTVPSAVPAFKEAGFPTWAIIAIGAAVLLPMLLKGK